VGCRKGKQARRESESERRLTEEEREENDKMMMRILLAWFVCIYLLMVLGRLVVSMV